MTKKLLSAVFAAVLVGTLNIVPASAETKREWIDNKYLPVSVLKVSGDFQYYARKDGTADIYKYNGNSENLICPSEINGKTVTSIGAGAFGDNKAIQTVEIPRGITDIGAGAFGGCSSLSKVTIPDTVEKIENFAFERCDSLVKIKLPTNIKKLTYTFCHCDNLKTVFLPKALEELDNAFTECTALQEIKLPKSLKKLSGAFAGCTALKKAVIPKNVKLVDRQSFFDTPNLKLEVARKNKYIKAKGNVVFSKNGKKLICYNKSPRKKYVVPKTVKIIGRDAFFDLNTAEQIVLPKTLKRIEDSAFNCCTAKINIPDSLTEIGTAAFSDTNITEFTVRKNMKIGKAALRGSQLKRLYVEKSVKRLPRGLTEESKKLKKIVIREKNVKIPEGSIGIANTNMGRPVKGLKIYGYKGSTAEKYVKEHNATSERKIKFIAL